MLMLINRGRTIVNLQSGNDCMRLYVLHCVYTWSSMSGCHRLAGRDTGGKLAWWNMRPDISRTR